MLGKKLTKPFDRMGYKLGNVPMVMGGKMNHRSVQSHQMPKPDKPVHSDLERRHEEEHEERRRRHH